MNTDGLRNIREETIENARCEVRVEACCSPTPSGGAQSHGCKEEQDWKSTKVGG